MGVFFLIIGGRVWYPASNPISWDVGGYYLYLPAQFIYNDLAMSDYKKFDSLRVKYDISSTFYQVYKTTKGKRIIKYTMGNAVMYAPFFMVGHAIAKITGQPTDGYSQPYQQSLLWGTFIYAFFALWFARKALLYFFDDKVTAITLLGIVIGTNLFFILSMDNLQSHFNLFFLNILFLWQSICFQKNASFKNVSLLGLWGGLIVLVRPTDIVIWAIPLLWGIQNPGDVIYKIKRQLKYLPIFIIIAFVIFSPQMVYWKTFTGKWLYNSYNNPGEGLDLFSPYTFPFLFSYRKGWLIYTPLVYFIIGGILVAAKSKREIFLSLFVFFILNLWIISSWTCWWYATSFSSRAMVQSYAILIIPFGLFIDFLIKKGRIIKATGFFILISMVLLNLFQIWQFKKGILKGDRMTKMYYWKSFGATFYNLENEKFLLHEKFLNTDTIADPENFYINKTYDFNWRDSTKINPQIMDRLVWISDEEGYCLVLDSSSVFYTILEDEYRSLTQKYYAYIRVGGKIKNSNSFLNNPIELVRTMEHKGELYNYNSNELFKNKSIDPNKWIYFTIDYVLPDVRRPQNKFKTYFWLRGKEPVYIKDLKVQVLEAKNFPELL